jgi:hypothetical protein
VRDESRKISNRTAPISAPWYDYKYIYRGGGTIDGRKDAARIKRLEESPDYGDISRVITGEVERGVEMMMFCAGLAPSREIPFHIQYLAAHQYIQDYYAGMKFTTHDAVSRCLCVIRASIVVRDALDEWEKGGDV